MKQVSLTVLAASALLTLWACAPTIDYRGKLPDAELVAQLKTGQTQEEVIGLIGSPTTVADYEKTKWLYTYKKTETASFFEPTVLEEKILALTFDTQGRLQSVEQQKPDGTVIDPLRYKTPTVGEDRPILKQVFGNFGKEARKKGK